MPLLSSLYYTKPGRGQVEFGTRGLLILASVVSPFIVYQTILCKFFYHLERDKGQPFIFISRILCLTDTHTFTLYKTEKETHISLLHAHGKCSFIQVSISAYLKNKT